MEWKADCCELKDQKNIVVKNKKENPNEFSGKLKFDNQKQYLCYDVNIACQLSSERDRLKNCDSLLVVFNTKSKKKLKELKDINSKYVDQKHFVEFKSGDLSSAFQQIVSTHKIVGFSKQLNFGYVVRNPKKKLYAQAKSKLNKYNKVHKGKILFKILKSSESININ